MKSNDFSSRKIFLRGLSLRENMLLNVAARKRIESKSSFCPKLNSIQSECLKQCRFNFWRCMGFFIKNFRHSLHFCKCLFFSFFYASQKPLMTLRNLFVFTSSIMTCCSHLRRFRLLAAHFQFIKLHLYV